MLLHFTFRRALALSVFLLRALPGENVLGWGCVAHTDSGKLRGTVGPGNVVTFLGVPYAEAPVGERRFRAPERLQPWDGVRDASSLAPDCLQSVLHNPASQRPESEDCLYLNVWTPGIGGSHPVVVWIHGGAFQQGGSYRDEYLGDRYARSHGVVVVSVAYRLGVLGFLVSVEDGLYGNYGLMDQRAALEFVQRNVQAFGGDPRRITLMGESAGAMSVAQHLLSPGAPGRLFQRAIMQSNPLAYQYRTLSISNFNGRSFKSHLDCADLHCLQTTDAAKVVEVQDALIGFPRSVGDLFTWGPVLTDERYLTETGRQNVSLLGVRVKQPLQEMARPDFVSPVPVLMGTNKHEGHIFVASIFPGPMNRLAYRLFIGLLFKDAAPAVLRHYAAQTLSESPTPEGSTGTGPRDEDLRPVAADILNDYLFRCPNAYAASLLHRGAPPLERADDSDAEAVAEAVKAAAEATLRGVQERLLDAPDAVQGEPSSAQTGGGSGTGRPGRGAPFSRAAFTFGGRKTTSQTPATATTLPGAFEAPVEPVAVQETPRQLVEDGAGGATVGSGVPESGDGTTAAQPSPVPSAEATATESRANMALVKPRGPSAWETSVLRERFVRARDLALQAAQEACDRAAASSDSTCNALLQALQESRRRVDDRRLLAAPRNPRGVPVFLYSFTHPSMVPDMEMCRGLSCHTAEVPFVFGHKAVARERYGRFSPAAAGAGATRGSGAFDWSAARPKSVLDAASVSEAVAEIARGVESWWRWFVDDDAKVAQSTAHYWTAFAKLDDRSARVIAPDGADYWLPTWAAFEEVAEQGYVAEGVGVAAQPEEPHFGVGPSFLELRWPPRLRELPVDATCAFWDRLKYKY